MKIRTIFVSNKKENRGLFRWHERVKGWTYFDVIHEDTINLRNLIEESAAESDSPEQLTIYLVDFRAVEDARDLKLKDLVRRGLPANCLLFKDPREEQDEIHNRLRPPHTALPLRELALKKKFVELLGPHLIAHHSAVLCRHVRDTWDLPDTSGTKTKKRKRKAKRLHKMIDKICEGDPLGADEFTTACEAMRDYCVELLEKLESLPSFEVPDAGRPPGRNDWDQEVSLRTSFRHAAALTLWKNRLTEGDDRQIRRFSDLMVDLPGDKEGFWFVAIFDAFLDFTFLSFFARLVNTLENSGTGGRSIPKKKVGEWTKERQQATFRVEREYCEPSILRHPKQFGEDYDQYDFLNTENDDVETSHFYFCEEGPSIGGQLTIAKNPDSAMSFRFGKVDVRPRTYLS